jgi:sugar lactone lactonase YvrE
MGRPTHCDQPGTSNALRATLAVALACLLSLAATPRLLACTGDCDGDDTVAIQELIRGVRIALGSMDLEQCPEFDSSGNNEVSIDELVSAVDSALNGCPVPLISTIVGTGVAGLNEDGLPPLQTYLYLPQDVTIGPDGNVYFADWNNHRIRRIKDGVVETVAGTGDLGDAHDGPSLETNFNHPTNVYFDHEGRMIIAAWHNSKVKRVDFTTGLIENIAGTGARSYGGDGGPGNEAILDLPSSVVVDTNDNVIISDQANYRLRLLEPNGIITTICGTGEPGYSGDGGPATQAQLDAPKGQSAAPAGRIDIDDRNRIYIADTGNHCIRMINEVGTITTIAGTGEQGYSGDGGPATAAQLNTPSDVAVAHNGTIYIADTMNNVVRHVKLDGTIETVAGTGERGFSGDGGPATEATLDRPYGLTVGPNGNVYVCDTHNQRIREITGTASEVPPTPIPSPTPVIIPCSDEAGTVCTYAGTGQTGFNGDGNDRLHTVLYWPFDIEFTASGRQIVIDWNNHRVREILPDGTFTTVMGTDFVGDGPLDFSDLTPEGADPLTVNLNHPTDMKEFSNGDLMLMAWHNHKIRELVKDTNRVFVLGGRGADFKGDGGPFKDALINQPPHGEFDADGNLFFIDQRNERIRVIYSFDRDRGDGIIQTVVGTGEQGFNGDGVALETQVNFPAGGNPEPSGSLAIDKATGTLYFSDTDNHRIRKVVFTSPDFLQGTVTTVAGTGEPGFSGDGGPADQAQIDYPEDIEIGPDGNLYFADTDNNRVRMIDLSDNTIHTVAGSGDSGYSGDGGPALDAAFTRPFGVAFDADGDLYISDTFNSRIRKVKR